MKSVKGGADGLAINIIFGGSVLRVEDVVMLWRVILRLLSPLLARVGKFVQTLPPSCHKPGGWGRGD